CLGRRRRSKASPSCERIEVISDLFVGVRLEQRREDLLAAIDRDHGFDAQFGKTLLAPPLTDRRVRRFAAQEGARSGPVPRAALVIPDPAGTGSEDGVAGRIERFLGDEPNELVTQVALSRYGAGCSSVSICARWSLPE